MHGKTAMAIAARIDRLLKAGWYLATGQRLDTWPDTWAVVYDWTPSDPNEIPAGSMYRMQYGATVVRDVVGFWPGGTAVARRLHLTQDETLWSQSGPAAETVGAAMVLSAPAGYLPDSADSELRWGATTSQVLGLFRARDWRLRELDGDGGYFQYTHGPGSAERDRPRFRHHGQRFGPLGICPLACQVTPDLEARIVGWRVHTGCPAHAGALESTAFHDPILPGTLDRLESDATTADLAALAYCLVYGDCSTHKWDPSTDYPDPSHWAR